MYPSIPLYRNSPSEQYHSHEDQKAGSNEPRATTPHHFPLRPIIISTRSQIPHNSPATESPSQQQPSDQNIQQYSHINSYLHSLRVIRYGDPEQDERWWEKDHNDEDVAMDMDEDDQDTSKYASINSVLRQAFLARRAHER
ncbi:hypothetical protein BGW37DRAFT_268945 [Umbelopsis sp. PMI_123]|nr:hypothetical protein BGW37DRAFT_268945 [Umbelopsis sp. PMI_123]